MQLSSLIEELEIKKRVGFKDINVASIEYDSRRVRPGSVFVAIPGEKWDGHDFISEAQRRGAVAFIVQKEVKTYLPMIVVEDTRISLGRLARRLYPQTEDLIKIGITGTNGKTTTTFLIHSVLNSAERPAGLIGTVYYWGREKLKAERTTPESLDIFRILEKFRNEGLNNVVMEVSSHALALKRVDEISFAIAIFTNLSQDHLDFHKTMEEYKRAKLRLFSLLIENGVAIYNLDDRTKDDIEAMGLKNTITYGMGFGAQIKGEIIADSLSGLRILIHHAGNGIEVNSPLIGAYNIYNILACFSAGIALGIEIPLIVKGIESLKDVRGRMEKVAENVFVDYAHTPIALQRSCSSLRKYTKGNLIVVFGCGGDRDREKRPQMGKIASENADYVIITSDNPRTEDPLKIIEEIKGGIENNYQVIEDRKEAIEYALGIKKENDILLIAGKGHEEYQEFKDKKVHFDDSEVVRNYFLRKKDV